MKKFLAFLVIIVAAYFVYDNYVKVGDVYELKASYNKQREAVDMEQPTIQPRDFANYTGTIKNISEKPLTNIVITYLIDAKPSIAKINKLEPGEEKNFSTLSVMLSHMDPAHHLKEVTFDEQ